MKSVVHGLLHAMTAPQLAKNSLALAKHVPHCLCFYPVPAKINSNLLCPFLYRPFHITILLTNTFLRHRIPILPSPISNRIFVGISCEVP